MVKKLLAGVAVLFAAYFIASPYITVHQMRTAIETENNTELSEYVEIPSIRQSLKDQLNRMITKKVPTEIEGTPFAALGQAFAGVVVDNVVESYVTLSGIGQLMAGEKLDSQNGNNGSTKPAKQPFSDAVMSYESFDKFVVTIKDSAGEDEKFVLRRRGMEWKLTEIIIPQL